MTRAAALLVCLVFALSREDSSDPVYVEAAKTAQTSSTTVLSDAAIPSLPGSFGQFVEGATKPKPRPKARTAPKQRTSPRQGYVAAGAAAGHACGGDLPPCYVMLRESGGSPTAYNPRGCNGNGCYGKWQFSGEWRCHFGLSCDIASWTEAEQDYAARTLWDHGRGCRHWAACS